MKEYIIRKVLNEEKIKEVHELIKNSTMWLDGHDTSGWGDEVRQTNLEMDKHDPYHPAINNIIMNAIDEDYSFHLFTWADSSNPVIVSKHRKGDWFKAHEDHPNNGNYTTTIFLDDPETYEGGELCFLLNGREEKFKLPAGHAITYNTGILHRVSEVTKGERNAIVFWSKGKARDRFLVDLYSDIDKLSKLCNKTFSDNNIKIEVDKHNLEETFNSPVNLFSSILKRIERKLLY
jgi:PKHD-type hydroxylase